MSKKLVCGHFQSHWTRLFTEQGCWDVQYCDRCRMPIRRKEHDPNGGGSGGGLSLARISKSA